MNHILFVEDDIKYQFVIKELLELEGYIVDAATNAADALSLFKENSYDLLLSDFSIGEVDGLQLTQLLRRIEPTLKVIILTGQDDDDVELQGLNLSIQDYIKKPVNFDILLKRVELAIDTKTVKGQRELRIITSAFNENE